MIKFVNIALFFSSNATCTTLVACRTAHMFLIELQHSCSFVTTTHCLIMEHLVQGKEWPVLGEDEVVVPPPVVPAVSQLEHVQDA